MVPVTATASLHPCRHGTSPVPTQTNTSHSLPAHPLLEHCDLELLGCSVVLARIIRLLCCFFAGDDNVATSATVFLCHCLRGRLWRYVSGDRGASGIMTRHNEAKRSEAKRTDTATVPTYTGCLLLFVGWLVGSFVRREKEWEKAAEHSLEIIFLSLGLGF